ncbi:MAG: ABC transporter permease [Synergistaceae bacterium]|nr:ABC transporter permease [Synergistaceae bacterium]
MRVLRSLFFEDRFRMLRSSFWALLFSLFAGALILLLMGKNPLSAYANLLQGAGLLPKLKYAGRQNQFTDFMSFLDAMTPMIFASLSVAAALRGGFFNIGVPGQMLAAGICAHVATAALGDALPVPLTKLLVLAVGLAAGMTLGAFTGWLRHRFNVNEVVTSIMQNSIAMYLITFYINTFYVNPVSRQSRAVSDAARLTLSGFRAYGLKIDVALAFPLALLTAFLARVFLNRTTFGFEIRALGLSKEAARYAGISPGRTTLLTMTISGGLAGLAGVSYFCGYLASIQPGAAPGLGFDAIAVALLGAGDPLGCVLASFLVTVISKGSVYMSSRLSVEPEIASLITSVILTFAACSASFGRRRAGHD